MILDLIEYAVTPCSWRARKVGFLTSSLQVQARYRRCRQAWEPHLDRTRRVIMEGAARSAARRKAVILGAGLLHDIPLRELGESFSEVILVDIVFPWSCRIEAARYRNVRCLAADVTGTIGQLAGAAADPGGELPVSKPDLFRDDPTVDFTVSVNLLSQLPVIPTRFLASHRGGQLGEPAIEHWSRHLQEAHLDYLRRMPGHTTLITDVGGFHRDPSGAVVHEWDNLHGLDLPEPDQRWEWELAPAPEADPALDHVARVAAYAQW